MIHLLATLASPHIHLAYWQETLIKVLLVLVAVPTATAIIVQTFLFKVMAYMQSRLGPMEAGPHGSLQLMADGAKFLQKELLAPERADRPVYMLAPVIVLLSTFMLYVVIPIGPGGAAENLDTGIFFALAVSSISVVGILAAGWASANKYSLIGGLRAAGQLIAYELPLVLGVVGVVMQAGTLSLQGIVKAQASWKVFGHTILGMHGVPFVIPQFVGFLLFLIASQAELTQTPFDMPVAESELVAGYQTEYSGLLFLFFYFGEFGTAFGLSAIAATLYLGGWYLPGWHPHGITGDLLGFVVLFAKTMLLAFVVFWIRFTYPRLREDQLQAFAWKFLIPLSLANIALTAVLKVVA
jgi:NADH-quinone oxidoreductase subunit H